MLIPGDPERRTPDPDARAFRIGRNTATIGQHPTIHVLCLRHAVGSAVQPVRPARSTAIEKIHSWVIFDWASRTRHAVLDQGAPRALDGWRTVTAWVLIAVTMN